MAPRTDKRNAAKAKAGKPRAKEKAASVRRDKTKTAEGTPPEVNTDEACPSAATGRAKEDNLGAFEAPRLLTALKYQIVSKKSTPSHKEAAQKLLDEYKNGDRKRKWNILESLTNRGFQDLTWTHSRSEVSTRKETESSEVLSGMMTRAKILQLNRFDEQQLEEAEAAELLEDLLQESESLHEHKRNKVPHRNPRLCRYFYKFNVGTTEGEQFEKEDRLEAYAETKGQKLMKSLDDAKDTSVEGSSDSFKAWSAMTGHLKKLKTQMQTHEDISVRQTELQTAKKKLQDALQELRMHIMESTTKHKRTDDCAEAIREREELKQRAEDAKADCAAQIELSCKCWVSWGLPTSHIQRYIPGILYMRRSELSIILRIRPRRGIAKGSVSKPL